MLEKPLYRIRPDQLAFDIDGVVADTMEVFVQLARNHDGLQHLTKEDLVRYDLHRCVPADSTVVDDLICRTLEDENTMRVPPMPGAPEVLSELAEHGPLRFVTARIWPESIVAWLHQTLSGVDRESIQVIATGDPAAKASVLRRMGVVHFLEDRLETCEMLAEHGIRPLLFDQPWNRVESRFPRICNWYQFRRWIAI